MLNIVEVENVSFGYANKPIFIKIGFYVRKGDFIAIIGANGAGKSTLLRLLLGELTPTAGYLRLFGQDVRHFRDWPKIGYLSQNGLHESLNFPATVEEIVQANLFSKIGLMRFPNKEHRRQTHLALERVGMAGYSKRMIGELSGGERQRVMLARVLVNDPEVMLLDEPTTGVDAQSAEALYGLLSRLNREAGITIVMITHDIARAIHHASKVLCLHEGWLEELDKQHMIKELAYGHIHLTQSLQARHKGDA